MFLASKFQLSILTAKTLPAWGLQQYTEMFHDKYYSDCLKFSLCTSVLTSYDCTTHLTHSFLVVSRWDCGGPTLGFII